MKETAGIAVSKAPIRQRRPAYRRYHIETRPAPDLYPHPHRFRVRVKKHRLAFLLLKELLHYRGNLRVVLSRPCVYGVFSGPLGGFAPREHLCVGCLRCTTQYPEVVQIHPNPEHRTLGDTYFTAALYETVNYEARTGMVPVRGAGYRGPFGGEGWDGMWTDMSEIVRPTRDGIHGREFISTVVDIGEKPAFLRFDGNGPSPRFFSLQVPFLFDALPLHSSRLLQILTQVAHEIESLAIVRVSDLPSVARPDAVAPLVTAEDVETLSPNFVPKMIELAGVHLEVFHRLRERFPQSVIALRLPYPSGEEILDLVREGVRVFHLTADYHGRTKEGRFVIDAIREVHTTLVEAGVRDEVTLIGSGGIVAAEHLPKAIICGLDAVALDTPLLAALQIRFQGECRTPESSRFLVPPDIPLDWGVQRLKNLAASWRDQLLEVLGAMGMREVRRLRGEMGRAMFQKDLEREAFEGIEGYEPEPASR